MASHTVLSCVYNLDQFHMTRHTTIMFLLQIRDLCLFSRQYRLIFLPPLLCILPMAPCHIGDALLIGTVTHLPCYEKTKWRCNVRMTLLWYWHMIKIFGVVSTAKELLCIHSSDAELWTNTGCDATLTLPFLCPRIFCIVLLHHILITFSHTHTSFNDNQSDNTGSGVDSLWCRVDTVKVKMVEETLLSTEEKRLFKLSTPEHMRPQGVG
jgi:hypothetical protein